MRTSGSLLVGMWLLMLLVCPPAYSQEGEAPQEASFLKGWTFDVAPFYLWIPALDGEVAVRGLSADVDLSVGDTLDLLFDSFKFVATGRAEARKGNALLTLDLMYLNLEENTQTDIGVGVDVRFKQLLLEFGGGYRLGEWSLTGEGKPNLSVDFLGGGRFVHLDNGITIENRPGVDRSQDWIEPFVGGRLEVDIIDKLSVAVRGDIGGFGVGSHFTWSMAAILAYQVSRRISLGAGYRILDINYSEGTGADHFTFDVQMRGPMLGFAIHF